MSPLTLLMQHNIAMLLPRFISNSALRPRPFSRLISHSSISSQLDIPTVDITALQDPNASARVVDEISHSVRHALSTVGFMYVKGCGIDETSSSHIMDAMKMFFDLDKVCKDSASMTNETYKGYYEYVGVGTQYETFAEDDVLLQADLFSNNKIEAFQTGIEPNSFTARAAYYDIRETPPNLRDCTKNRWPKARDDVRNKVLSAMSIADSAGLCILQAVSLSLGLGVDHLGKMHMKKDWSYEMKKYHGLSLPVYDNSFASLSLKKSYDQIQRHLAESQSTRVLRVRTHADLSTITLLLHTDEDSLEIFHQDRWICAPKIPDAVLVNSGNILETWTDGLYKSARHRVVSCIKQQTPDRIICPDRMSFVCFVMPDWHASLAPLLEKEQSPCSNKEEQEYFGDVIPIQT